MTTRNAILAIAFATLGVACGANSRAEADDLTERDDKKEARSDFCPTVFCAEGTVCDEKQNKCVRE